MVLAGYIVLARMQLDGDNQAVVVAVSGIVSQHKETDAYYEWYGCCIVPSDICCARDVCSNHYQVHWSWLAV